MFKLKHKRESISIHYQLTSLPFSAWPRLLSCVRLEQWQLHLKGRDVSHAEEQPDQAADRGGPWWRYKRPGGDHTQEDGKEMVAAKTPMFHWCNCIFPIQNLKTSLMLMILCNFIICCPFYIYILFYYPLYKSLVDHKPYCQCCFHSQDNDHDGRLSFSDFEKAVRDENLLLEAFGTCLPDTMVITSDD